MFRKSNLICKQPRASSAAVQKSFRQRPTPLSPPPSGSSDRRLPVTRISRKPVPRLPVPRLPVPSLPVSLLQSKSRPNPAAAAASRRKRVRNSRTDIDALYRDFLYHQTGEIGDCFFNKMPRDMQKRFRAHLISLWYGTFYLYLF